MNWIESHQLGWNPWQAQKSAQDMYERIFTMKFLPIRSWFVGYGNTNYRRKRGCRQRLNNCPFVSTKTLKDDYSNHFVFLWMLTVCWVLVLDLIQRCGEIVVKGRSER